MSDTLYERLGGSDNITRIAADAVDNHLANPVVSTRYENSPMNVDEMKKSAAAFFITGTGGPAIYEGKNLLDAHRGMNINATEFMAVLDDILSALEKNDVTQKVQEEVLFVLYSMRKENRARLTWCIPIRAAERADQPARLTCHCVCALGWYEHSIP